MKDLIGFPRCSAKLAKDETLAPQLLQIRFNCSGPSFIRVLMRSPSRARLANIVVVTLMELDIGV